MKTNKVETLLGIIVNKPDIESKEFKLHSLYAKEKRLLDQLYETRSKIVEIKNA